MIKWPIKLNSEDYQCIAMRAECVGWNAALAACIEAEKKGRISVDEIAKILLRWDSVIADSELAKDMAHAISNAMEGSNDSMAG